MTPVLIAGIGNIFNGDDGFGVAVAAELQRRAPPPELRVVDFGIRGIDLAYALTAGCEAAILVDCMARGGAPGTLYVMEPTLPPADCGAADQTALSPHAMEPHNVLRVAALLGAVPARLLLVGCEPLRLDADDTGEIGLSPPVAASVAPAADAVLRLARELLQQCAIEEVK
ncbi:MAG TPA: hydrogenase maturation protease [Stellaceae bacterium]|nr:hydrogenase maturation protease [Stellaceae bacterium]